MSQLSLVDQSRPENSLKNYSCLTCRQRKVKCDRRNPCNNCVKAEKQCSFIAPVRGKRKRAKPPKEGLHARLKRYEELLKTYGAKVETNADYDDSDVETATLSHPDVDMRDEDGLDGDSPRQVRDGHTELEKIEPKLIGNSDSSRYVESALWTNLGDEMGTRLLYPTFTSTSTLTPPAIHQSNGKPHESTSQPDILHAGLFFEPEPGQSPPDLTGLHLPSHILPKIRDIFVDRVDPLIKILHIPTFRTFLREGAQRPQDLSAPQEALIIAFYLGAISTLQDDECLGMFGQPSSTMQARYRSATQQALAKAQFLSTSDLATLQAFAIFIMCARNTYHVDTLFILSGVAIRLARKMGLHRDGFSLGLSIFETEMRRRLWWHLVLVDVVTADVLGTRPSLDISSGDAKLPLNVEDEDLKPDMVSMPVEPHGITAATCCLVKCELMQTLKQFSTSNERDLRWEVLHSSDMALPDKDSVIRQLEDQFESKYLRYCDPSNSLHTLVSIMIRSTICKLKLFAHNPRRFAIGPAKVPDVERNIVFSSATKLLEYAMFIRAGNNGLSKYIWQIGTSYLWSAMVYLLIEMRHRRTGPEVNKSWELLGVVFASNPQVFEGTSEPVFVALSKWTLEVWHDYVAASIAEGHPEPSVPEYVNAIQRARKPAEEAVAEPQALSTDDPFEPYDFPDLLALQMDPNEWYQWEQLMVGQKTFS